MKAINNATLITNLSLVFGISLMTSFFVFFIQYASSSFLKSENDLNWDEIIDTENIHGHIIADTTENTNNNVQSDRLLSDEELIILDKDGFIRVDDYNDGENALSLSIDKLFVDLSLSQYSDIFDESEIGKKEQVRLKTSSGLPLVVKMCGSARIDTPCSIKIKNEDTAQAVDYSVKLKKDEKENLFSLEQSDVGSYFTEGDSQFVGKGVIEVEVSTLR